MEVVLLSFWKKIHFRSASITVRLSQTTWWSFPTLKNAGAANSMQVADVQLFDAAGTGIFAPGDTILGVQVDGALVPEPSTGLLALLGLAGLLRRRR
jgi:hypothetical protein